MGQRIHPLTESVVTLLLLACVVGVAVAGVAAGAFLLAWGAIWVGGLVALGTGVDILWILVSAVLGPVLLFVYFDLITSYLQV